MQMHSEHAKHGFNWFSLNLGEAKKDESLSDEQKNRLIELINY